MDRTSFATHDELEAASVIETMFGTRFAMRRPADGNWTLTIDRMQVGEVGLTDVRVPGELTYDLDGRDEVRIATVLAGDLEFERDQVAGRYRRGDVYVGSAPEGGWRARSRDVRIESVSLPAALLASVATTDPDSVAPVPRFLSDLALPGRAGHWRRTVRFVARLHDDENATPSPLVLGAAARLLAATALEVFPTTLGEPRASGDRDAHPDTVSRATAYIDAHPDLDLTVLDIARAASVTPRAVQLAFRRHLDTTPLAYLRRVRLHHARQELLDADPGDGTTVTRVANTWGFASPSRFAAQYRAAYSESPSDTLRR